MPDHDRIEPQFLGGPIDHRLHDEYAMRHAGAAVGADDRRVGIDGDVFRMNRADLVRARHDALAAFRDNRAVGAISAAVVVIDVAQRRDAAITLQAELDLVDHEPFVIGAEKMFGAILDPLDWPLEEPCRERNHKFLRV